MIGLDRIVGVSLDVMPRRGDKFVQDGGEIAAASGDHLARRHVQHGQGSLEEPAGAVAVTPGGTEHVDDLPALVEGPVDVAPDTVDLDIGLIDNPPVTR